MLRAQAPVQTDLNRVGSGSVRSHILTVATTVSSGANVLTHRTRDKTNVDVANPWIEGWNGYINGTGQHGAIVEVGTGASFQYRAAFVTGISGTAANQTGATVWPCTFYKMLDVPGFVQAGGAVSADGKTITVPDKMRFRSDPMPGLLLAAGSSYFTQQEFTYTVGANRISGRSGIAALGDMRLVAGTNTANVVHSADFSTGASITGSTAFPLAVLGYVGANVKTVGVEGDSIISTANAAPDADGACEFAKIALNAAGYSFVDVGVPGTNISDMKLGGWAVRMGLLSICDAVITDHGHNDRGAAAVTQTWAGALPYFQWHTGLLRASARRGAKIVRTTLLPHTTTTDAWATSANQSYQTTSDTYPTGWQFTYNDYLMRRGTFSGVPFSGLQDPDAAFDYASAIGMSADGKWPVTGTANYATTDGTHPSTALMQLGVAALQPSLKSLLGF